MKEPKVEDIETGGINLDTKSKYKAMLENKDKLVEEGAAFRFVNVQTVAGGGAALWTGSEMIECTSGTSQYPIVEIDGESNSVELAPIKVQDFTFHPGVNVIIGGPGTGKTYFMSLIQKTVEDDLGLGQRSIFTSWMEPDDTDLRNEMDLKIEDIPDHPNAAMRKIASAIADPAVRVCSIDSVSMLMLANWSGFSTMSGGLNPGMFFWLTALDRAAVKTGTILILSLNPSIEAAQGKVDIASMAYTFAKGRVVSCTHLQRIGEAVVTSRKENNREELSKSIVKYSPASGATKTTPTTDIMALGGDMNLHSHRKLGLK